jgi:hypothetical protein
MRTGVILVLLPFIACAAPQSTSPSIEQRLDNAVWEARQRENRQELFKLRCWPGRSDDQDFLPSAERDAKIVRCGQEQDPRWIASEILAFAETQGYETLRKAAATPQVPNGFTRTERYYNYKAGGGEIVGLADGAFYRRGNGAEWAAVANNEFARNAQGDNWSVACKTDPISDKRSCHVLMHQNDGGDIYTALYVFERALGSPIVCIGSEHYPGTPVQIRVDSLPPHSVVDKDGCFNKTESQAILSEMSRGSRFVSRFQQWPYRSWVTTEKPTFGFRQAVALMRWLYPTQVPAKQSAK